MSYLCPFTAGRKPIDHCSQIGIQCTLFLTPFPKGITKQGIQFLEVSAFDPLSRSEDRDSPRSSGTRN